MASFAGLPGSGGLRYSSNSGKLLDIEAVQHPPLAGSGVQLAPQREFEGSALIVTPPNFCFQSLSPAAPSVFAAFYSLPIRKSMI